MSKIDLLKDIMKDVEEDFLKNESSYIVMEEYEYFREAITLYAKQNNLIESVLLLMENNMNEEAMILARSVLNNYFLVSYILDDPQKKHLKEYQIQPIVTSLYYWNNAKQIMQRPFWQKLINEGKSLPFKEQEVDNNIAALETAITKAGFPKSQRPLSIKKLAENADERGLELYVTFYSEASKFEHSDISCLDIYKEKILENDSNNQVFKLNMNKTDESLKEKIMSMIIISYTESFIKLVEEVTINNPHLKAAYNEKKLPEIMIKIIALVET